ncbi:hypothetical protein B0H13DRAFT_1877597 [Mycena leptocephala]|nr:hypothetical protein B0H13DRAFT_1877597 [Mycena leptocephala]
MPTPHHDHIILSCPSKGKWTATGPRPGEILELRPVTPGNCYHVTDVKGMNAENNFASITFREGTVIVDQIHGACQSFIAQDQHVDRWGISISSLSTEYSFIDLTRSRRNDISGKIFYMMLERAGVISHPREGSLFYEHEPPPEPLDAEEISIEIKRHKTEKGNFIEVIVNIPLRGALRNVWAFYAATLMGWVRLMVGLPHNKLPDWLR